MPLIPFEAQGFSQLPHYGRMYASMPMLQWAAVTVGVSAISASTGSRPLAELSWRSALMDASLEQSGNRWLKTDAYVRLDASEKSAVSYFLGMAQAQLSSDLLLGVPSLVHIDTYLRTIGQSVRKSRPDFLGYDPRLRHAIVLEAKGRTHGYTDALVAYAKNQASKLPSLNGAATTAEIASVAWFDADRVWHALLVDPPRRRQVTMHPAFAVLAAHYVPVVRAAIATRSVEDDGERVWFEVRAVDLTVSLPSPIFHAVRNEDRDEREPWSERALSDAGHTIADLIRQNTAASEISLQPNFAEQVGSSTEYHGGDLIGIHLGDSWMDRLR
ncbi:hypothetical protein ACFVUS_27840 [Nocardia sp. NPDC058058]|uniref:hypothetical protein n=1 Tax=Nocardia sp. NPDC058058 TaxID=3346317 RepID=UPI0036D87C65